MLKISYADCLGLSLAILTQFNLKICVTVRNHKKFIKNSYFKSSRLLKVIDIDTSENIVTNACYDNQHPCANLQSFLCWASQ